MSKVLILHLLVKLQSRNTPVIVKLMTIQNCYDKVNFLLF